MEDEIQQLEQDEADIEQTFIEIARRDVLAFTLFTKPDYQVGWHHKFLADKLNKFARGEIRNLMVFMPPRHGKSELVSRRFPAWLHGLYPDTEIMAASYLDTLAGEMTIAVQNIIDSKEYQKVFPKTKIHAPRSHYAEGLRNTSEHHIVGRKGKYRGQGVGGSFTGKGANFIIVDDPIKGREIADSETFREKLWKFWKDDLYSRRETDLKTGREGQVLITQCMTGDTQVLMGDCTEKALRDINAGDLIATYENGRISTSKVRAWKNNGLDLIFAIRTSSGITVKANERHPFLVCRNGVREWVRLRDLRVNDKMIRVGGSGKESNARIVDAEAQQDAKDFACLTTTKQGGRQDIGRRPLIQMPEDPRTLDKGTESTFKRTILNLMNRIAFARYAELKEILQSIGSKNFALTIATNLERSGGFFVTNVISFLNMEIRKKFYLKQLNIYEDTIVEIAPCGTEDVFDIQVDRTENFIANGVVSHNTRWHEDDLSGRLLDQMKKDPEAIQFDIVNFPAIRVDMDNPDDPRRLGEALWPEKYSIKALEEIRATQGPRGWGSLYQQDPRPDGGALFKETMFEFCDLPREFDWSFITADTSYKEKEENDFTVFSAWGVIKDQLYLKDVWRKQIKSADVEPIAESFIKKNKSLGYRWTYIEPKGHGIYLNQKFKYKGLNIPNDEDLKDFYHDRRLDKVERANNVIPELAHRKVKIGRNVPDKETLLNEALSFPKAKHDDFTDTLVDALKAVYNRKVSTLDVYSRA